MTTSPEYAARSVGANVTEMVHAPTGGSVEAQSFVCWKGS